MNCIYMDNSTHCPLISILSPKCRYEQRDAFLLAMLYRHKALPIFSISRPPSQWEKTYSSCIDSYDRYTYKESYHLAYATEASFLHNQFIYLNEFSFNFTLRFLNTKWVLSVDKFNYRKFSFSGGKILYKICLQVIEKGMVRKISLYRPQRCGRYRR